MFRELIYLCQASSSNTTLIAICNALDIYQKLFHSAGDSASVSNSQAPQIVHFPPYNVDQISRIIRGKIQDGNKNYGNYFKVTALKYFAALSPLCVFRAFVCQ